MRNPNFGGQQPAGTSFNAILVATDLSPRENTAVQRAAQLAQAHRASLKLVHLPARGQPAATRAAARLAHLAAQLEEDFGLCITTCSDASAARRTASSRVPTA